jgi:tetratricopeptide (TPR) repeat protein
MDTFETAKDYFLKGLAFQQKGIWDEAERMYSESLNHVPNRPSTLINLANTQYQLNKLDSARKTAEKAVETDPGNPDALCQLGAILVARGSNKAAVEILDKCLGINPKLAEAYSNRGNALKELKRLDEALASYEKAIALKPSIDFILGHYCLLAQSLGNWAVFDKWAGTIIQKTEAGEKACNPWAASLMFDDPRLLYQSAQIFSEKFSRNLFS